MGRTKGSKNGVRKVPLKKPKVKKEIQLETRRWSDGDDEPTFEMEQSDLPVFSELVLKAYRGKRYEKCIELIERILMNNNDEDKEHYKILLAASHTMLGVNFEAAHTTLDEVLRADPANSFALYGKGIAFYFQRQMNQSLDMLNRAIEANPGPEMERARQMKMQIDIERRRAVIMLHKMKDDEKDLEENSDTAEEAPANDICGVTTAKHAQVLQVVNNNSDDVVKSSEDNLMSPAVKENDKALKIAKSEDITTTSIATKEFKEATKENSDPPPAIPELLPKSFIPTTGEEFLAKGVELYISGSLKKSLRMFEKAIKLDPSLSKAEELGTKAQELIELMDVAAMNMEQKNYSAVVEILNEALEVDETNDFVNRPFYFQRGLANFHLGKNAESLKDYAEFDRINKILSDP